MSHETMITTLRQDLLEHIGEWLDSKTVTCEENYMGLGPNEDKDDELHIKMADAAMYWYCNALGLLKNKTIPQVPAVQKWNSLKDKTPTAYESGNWDGKRSEWLLVSADGIEYHVARAYVGTLDGSEFCTFEDSRGYEIENVVWWAEIDSPF